MTTASQFNSILRCGLRARQKAWWSGPSSPPENSLLKKRLWNSLRTLLVWLARGRLFCLRRPSFWPTRRTFQQLGIVGASPPPLLYASTDIISVHTEMSTSRRLALNSPWTCMRFIPDCGAGGVLERISRRNNTPALLLLRKAVETKPEWKTTWSSLATDWMHFQTPHAPGGARSWKPKVTLAKKRSL